MKSKNGWVYTLASSRNEDLVRYIGYTTKPINKRLIEHLSDSKNLRTRKDKWIQCEIKNGFNIILNILCECESAEDLKRSEIQFILLYKAMGARLTNGTLGGDGQHGYKHSAKFKRWNSRTKSKKIYVFNYKSGELLHEFKSGLETCKQLKIVRSRLGNILAGRDLSSKGFWFSHTNNFNPREPVEKIPWNKGIKTRGTRKFKTTQILVSTPYESLKFETVREASEYLKCSHSYVCAAYKRNRRINGFKIEKCLN